MPADTYLSYVLSKPLTEVWKIFLLGMGRVVPAIAIAPFFGGKLIANPIKLGFGAAITFIFLPFLVVHVKDPISMDATFILLLVKEIVIGAILGFIIAIPFYFSQGAGALIDHQRGSQSLQVMDPTTMMQTSPTGTLFNDMMLVSFFFIGGPMFFFEGIFSSYTVLGAADFFPSSFEHPDFPLWVLTIKMLNTVVTISLQLAAPSLIAMLLSDLFLGIANRMAPQVQISFLLWSLKAFIGIAMLWVGWWLVIKQLDTQAISWTKVYQKLSESLG